MGQIAKSNALNLQIPSIVREIQEGLLVTPAITALHDHLQKQVNIAGLPKLNPLLGITSTYEPLISKWINGIFDQYHSGMRGLFESIGDVTAWIYPENLRELKPPLRNLEALLVDEGIPLMWVPRTETVAALFAQADTSGRRRVLRQRWRGVVRDCEVVIEKVDHPELADARYFALDCVRALREGYSNGAQALATNLLDSLMQQHFEKQHRIDLTKNDFKQNGVRFDMNDRHIREAFVFAPVWYAYAKYRPRSEGKIPREFGRHPSAHGVSRRQYSRINAVIGLMLATSVLRFFDLELSR